MVHFAITLSLITAVFAFNTDKRCLLHDGKCISHCPRNMFAYHTKCDGQTRSQKTCDYPLSYVIGYTCGWSRCDCSGDLVLNEQTNYCVEVDDCPTAKLLQPKTARERRRYGRRRHHISKKIKFDEDELTELS